MPAGLLPASPRIFDGCVDGTSASERRLYAHRLRNSDVDAREFYWRLSLLVLTLSLCCRRGQSSHKRLHLLNWAVRTPGARRQLLAALDGAQRPQDVLARTDPVLNQVIDYAAGEGLVAFPRGDRVRLTGAGENLVTSVLEVEDCFASEREFLAALSYRVTEEWVKRVMSIGVSQ